MAYEQCLSEIQRAAGGKLSDDDLKSILDNILKRKQASKNAVLSDAQKMKEAATQVAQQYTEAQRIRKINEVKNEVKKLERRSYYENAPSPEVGLEAKIFGVNAAFAGSRLSTAAKFNSLKRDLIAASMQEMDKIGVGKLFSKRTIETEWTDELFELNSRDGKPGVSGNKQALQIAEIVHKYQRDAINRLNNEGAWIRDYNGYIARSTHDSDKIREMGKDAWIDLVTQHIDIDRTFGDVSRARAVLARDYSSFVNGDHMKFEDVLDNVAHPSMSVAKKQSAAREYHFKSAADWRAYNKSAGSMNPTQTIYSSFESSARNIAMMQDWGTNPRAALKNDIEFLQNKYANDPKIRSKLDDRVKWLETAFGYIDGEALRPVNRTGANIVSYWMTAQRLAKLGFAAFSSLTDGAHKAMELRYQGFNLLERYASFLPAYRPKMLRGDKEVLQLLRAGMESRMGTISARLEGSDSVPGVVSQVENAFFKWTLQTGMTVNQRQDAEAMMARKFGIQHGKSYDNIQKESKRVLKLFNIASEDWELLRSVDWTQANGRKYLTPNLALQIDKAKIYDHLLATGKDPSPAKIKKYQNDLSLKLQSLYYDRGTYAIIEPGERTQMIMRRGTQSGTVMGTMNRLFYQFKAFPIATIEKTWGRELKGGQGKMSAVMGMAEFMVASTVLGYGSMVINDLLKGREPRSATDSRTWLAAFIKGGGGSFYGDFVFGDYSRHGQSLLASLAGPTFGQIDSIASIWNGIRSGNPDADTAAESLRMATSNTPFLNNFYTKALVDYMFIYSVQEWLNPGYLSRMEGRLKKNQDQEFLLKPTQYAARY